MEREYQLTAGAILYALILMRQEGIYGVYNVLDSLDPADFSSFAQTAESELMEKNCGILDFDGVLSLDEEFASLLGRCADCGDVLCITKRCHQRQERLTVYLCGEVCPALEYTEEYTLYPNVDPVEAIIRFLNLPDGKISLTQALVDSTLVEKLDLDGLRDSGCPSDMAQLAINAAQGTASFAQAVRMVKPICAEELYLIYGAEGIASVAAEYNESQELFRLTPLSAGEAGAIIAAMTKPGGGNGDVA